MLVHHSHPDQIVELQLARPPVNAFNPELVSALRQALQSAVADGAQGVVLSGQPGLFSAGLDVPALLQLDRDGMAVFWRDFFALLQSVAACPVPLVSAITGHSPAGGTVVALFADYRVQADGPFQLGLNEVQVGLVVPPLIHQALVRLIGAYPAERHLVAGQMIDVAQAKAIGLVDEVVAADQVVPTAVAWLQRHLAMPQHAMQATRRLCRAELVQAFEAPGALDIATFVDGWFSEATQASLQQLVARIKARAS